MKDYIRLYQQARLSKVLLTSNLTFITVTGSIVTPTRHLALAPSISSSVLLGFGELNKKADNMTHNSHVCLSKLQCRLYSPKIGLQGM